MIENDSLNAQHIKNTEALMSKGIYFGPDGAMEYFREKLLHEASRLLATGDVHYAMMFLNILWVAITHQSSQGLFKKLNAAYLAYEAHMWADRIRKSTQNIIKGHKTEDIYTLMSLSVYFVQIVSFLRRLPFFRKSYAKCMRDVDNYWTEISKRSEKEVVTFSCGRRVLGPLKFLELKASSHLYVLHIKGLYDLGKKAPDIKEKIWLYCMGNEKTHSKSIALEVVMLFRSIGKYKEAEIVLSRFKENKEELQSVHS